MSNMTIALIVNCLVFVAGVFLSVSDKQWVRSVSRPYKVGFFIILLIPFINILLVALMLSGKIMARALFGKEQ